MTKKTAIIILISCIVISNIFTSLFRKYYVNRNIKDNQEHQEQVVDTEAPKLILKENKFIIYQGVDFDYNAFIVSAIDNIDGDLKEKVKYNQVDTSSIGSYEIKYSVTDNAGNESSEILELIVKEDIGS